MNTLENTKWSTEFAVFVQRLFSVRKLQGELLNEKEPLPTIGTDAFCTLRKKNTLLPPNDLS